MASGKLRDTCTHDASGDSHALLYADANDASGDLTVYAWSTSEDEITVTFETPNLIGNTRISAEKVTSVNMPPASQEFPASIAVSIVVSTAKKLPCTLKIYSMRKCCLCAFSKVQRAKLITREFACTTLTSHLAHLLTR